MQMSSAFVLQQCGERSERCKHLWAMHPLQAYSEDRPSLPEVIATLMLIQLPRPRLLKINKPTVKEVEFRYNLFFALRLRC